MKDNNDPTQISVKPTLQPNELVKPLDLPPDESRVEKHMKKDATRNILIVLSGLVILGVFLFFFGIPLLIGFSKMTEKDTTPQVETEQSSELDFDEPPKLSAPFEATNSAQVKLTGYSKADYEIVLYRNGSEIKTTTVKDNGRFTFNNVTLEEGGNILKAKAVYKKKESDYSDSIIITYSKDKPTIEISFPQEGQTIKRNASPITVKGQTAEGNTVTINGSRAVVQGDGIFSYELPLTDGDNTFTAEATDEAGNTVNKEVKFKTE